MIEVCTKEPTREGFPEEEVFTDKERFFFFLRRKREGVCRENSLCKGMAMGRSLPCLGNGEHSHCAAAIGCRDRLQEQKLERQTGVRY